MAKFTNHGAGMRGIVLKDDTTVWVEPGETVEVEADVKHVHDDFKGEAKAEDAKPAAKADAKPEASKGL